MPAAKPNKLVEIHSVDEIPSNMTESEEHEFWETHCLGEELLLQMESPDDDNLPPPRAEAPDSLERIAPHELSS